MMERDPASRPVPSAAVATGRWLGWCIARLLGWTKAPAPPTPQRIAAARAALPPLDDFAETPVLPPGLSTLSGSSPDQMAEHVVEDIVDPLKRNDLREYAYRAIQIALMRDRTRQLSEAELNDLEAELANHALVAADATFEVTPQRIVNIIDHTILTDRMAREFSTKWLDVVQRGFNEHEAVKIAAEELAMEKTGQRWADYSSPHASAV